MRLGNTFALLMVISFSPLAASQDNTKAEVLDVYATLMGGWYLNQKCNFLSDELKKDFGMSLQVIQMDLNKKGITKDIFKKLHVGSKEVTEKKPYLECGNKARMLVAEISLKAWNIALKIVDDAKKANKKS